MSPQFRPAGIGDVPLIRSLAIRIWHESYRDLLSEAQRNYMLDWMYAHPKLDTEIRRGVAYRIVELEGEPAGYLAWEPLPDRTTLHLHKLYLLGRYQGRGVGRAMLECVFEAARAGGFASVELRVNRGNTRALRAYERAGFERADTVITDIGNGFVMDDYILRKSVETAPA
ncbi:MAG: GNAT family N-acetyltransferase [Verrucomicrobiales bacterium]|nr:GNAT family N-acetyltransferase [Verrucomicrobiales bacterium]